MVFDFVFFIFCFVFGVTMPKQKRHKNIKKKNEKGNTNNNKYGINTAKKNRRAQSQHPSTNYSNHHHNSIPESKEVTLKSTNPQSMCYC